MGAAEAGGVGHRWGRWGVGESVKQFKIERLIMPLISMRRLSSVSTEVSLFILLLRTTARFNSIGPKKAAAEEGMTMIEK